MRDIEFRGKRADNGEWVFGNLVRWDDDGYSEIHTVANPNVYEKQDVIPETVGQYTGLLDRRGVKIFEGDCLRDEDGKTGQVIFRNGRFMGDFDGRTYYHQLHLDADKCEVIGNIHDNPELLEERK